MNELQVFNNREFGTVRTLVIDEEPWFVGKEVAEILEYGKGSSAANAVAKHVDPEDKGVTKMMTPGGMQNVTIINESGLYSLIFSSKMPKAKEFKRWVTSEVLPAIRKHGVYAVDEVLKNPDMLIEALTELKKERAARMEDHKRIGKLEERVAVQGQQIAEMRPKASYYDIVLNSKDLVSVSSIAKDYGWSAQQMNNYLHERGVQYRQGKTWLLYQKYAEKGYTSTKTHSYAANDGEIHTQVHTYWTQAGRLFIYDLLKTDGILPVIERKANEAVAAN